MLDRVVKLPEVTAKASLTYSFERIERIEEYFGERWFASVMDALEPPRPSVLRTLLEIGLDDADVDVVVKHMTLGQIARKVGDALMLAMRGKTLDQLEIEQVKEVVNGVR